MTKKISEKDKKDWENFLLKKEKLQSKDVDLKKKKKFQKIRTIDLHGYTLDQANKKITDFINESFLAGISKLIVVTGKGSHSQNNENPYVSKKLSILKYSVPEYITNNKELMEIIYDITDAKTKDGGSGAFYIYLKKTFF